MPGTQFFDPRLFFIAGQAREEHEHRCQAGFAGLQYGLDPFEDPLLTGGQAHRLPRSACRGAGHPPAATPAASTRAPAQLDDDMAVAFPGIQIHADHKGAFLLQQQGRVLTQRLVRQLPTLRRTPAVSYSAAVASEVTPPAGTPGTGFPFAVCAGGAAACGEEDRYPDRCHLLRRRPPPGWRSTSANPLPGVLADWARAVSRWPSRSSRSWLTAAVSRRDCLSPRRASRPRREVRRARPAAGSGRPGPVPRPRCRTGTACRWSRSRGSRTPRRGE